MDGLAQDLRYAARSLLKSPGFATAAVLTLALGIGATTTVFSVIEGVLLRPLPFPDADRLAVIMQVQERYRGPLVQGGTSPLSSYLGWRTAGAAFEGMAVYRGQPAILRGFGPAERLWSWSVSANLFPLLGARPSLGQALVADDDKPGSPPVAILSHGFWEARLGSDRRVMGRTITLDTTTYTIVGVMPERFRYPAGTDLWTNLGALLGGPSVAEAARSYSFWVIGRLRPGVSAAEAQRQLYVVSRRAWVTDPKGAGWVPVVTPLHVYLTGRVRSPLLITLGAVSLVLLIACANAASLVFARALTRQHQVAVRAALGAGRGRLVQASLAESLVIALGGGAVGLLIAVWCVPLLVRLAGSELPAIAAISVDGRVLLTCLGTTLLAGLLAGAVPAWHAARKAPAEVIKTGGEGRAAAARGRLGSALIVGQLALTLVLLAGAALLLRSFARLTRLDPGFDPGRVIVAEVNLPATRYRRDDQRLAFVKLALERLNALPGVTAAAVGTGIPLAGGGFTSVDRSGPEGESSFIYWVASVSPGYFHALGIPLLRGRTLQSTDPGAVVIDSAAARVLFPGLDPIGKPFSYWGATRTVVGIVGNVRQEPYQAPPPPHVYDAYSVRPAGYVKVLVVARGDPRGSVALVRRTVQAVDLDVPVVRVEPLTGLIADALARQRLYSVLLGVFGAVALVLSAVGVYGLVSFGVSRRTREFGIRIALGAGRGSVLRLVVGRALLLAALGLALGLAGALAATRTLRGFLFELRPSDPGSLLGASVVLFVAALAASLLPALRATRADPVVALRAE
jgi:predicted permease